MSPFKKLLNKNVKLHATLTEKRSLRRAYSPSSKRPDCYFAQKTIRYHMLVGQQKEKQKASKQKNNSTHK
jgi:hypothetical protein